MSEPVSPVKLPFSYRFDRAPSVDVGETPTILLTNGGYFGTLAMARAHGRRGQTVELADAQRLSKTGASKYVSREHRCPPVISFDDFVDWLLKHGRANPGQVLYPSSDDLCWQIAQHADALGQHYRLFTPSLDTVRTLLSKPDLYALAESVGMNVPPTVAPTSLQELHEQVQTIQFPALIKPRSQVALPSHKKAVFVQTVAEACAAYENFQTRFGYAPVIHELDAQLEWPMVQTFSRTAAINTYSVGGYVDPERNIFMARASAKIMQFPIRVGVGLCFEGRPLDPDIASQLKALSAAAGYAGVFEAEFITMEDGVLRLMDFNPRYYGQSGFEIARALPLDQLVVAAAYGKHDYIQDIQRADDAWQHEGDYRFCDARRLRRLLATLSFAGEITWMEKRRWLNWACEAGPGFDMVADPIDMGPSRADLLNSIKGWLVNPRSTFIDNFRV